MLPCQKVHMEALRGHSFPAIPKTPDMWVTPSWNLLISQLMSIEWLLWTTGRAEKSPTGPAQVTDLQNTIKYNEMVIVLSY